MTSPLPGFVQDLLAAPPRAGEGVHNWLFRLARQLHAHLPAVEIVNLLEARIANCGRHVGRKEIEDAVKNSLACAWQPGAKPAAPPTTRKWPAINQEQRQAIIHNGGGLADLWEASPVRMDDNLPHTEAIIDALFPGNPLLCIGKYIPGADGATEHHTRPRSEWCGLQGWELIVPSPMTAAWGTTKEGKDSQHTLANTGPRRFLVCEFDDGTVDEHAAILLHLGHYAPMVCVTHSGGKSLHGWFYVAGQPEEKSYRFFRYAVSVGADSAMWTRSQFARMPDGTRGNGNRQTVFFLSLKPLEAQR